MRILLTTSLFFLINFVFSQNLLKKGEKSIYSFTTFDGKKLVLASDSAETYLQYRFGNSDKIEFEFPKNKEKSFSKFNYSYYLRGGGAENEGLDLNYLYFINEGYKYIVYNEYYAPDDKSVCGIKIINLKNKEIKKIEGDIKTEEGNLIEFRFNEHIEQVDGLPSE